MTPERAIGRACRKSWSSGQICAQNDAADPAFWGTQQRNLGPSFWEAIVARHVRPELSQYDTRASNLARPFTASLPYSEIEMRPTLVRYRGEYGMLRLFSQLRSIAAGRESRERHVERHVGSDQEWDEFKNEVAARMRAIASETGTARNEILARHTPPEAAYNELVALYEYSKGRMAGARELLERRRFGSRTQDDSRPSELQTRCEAIRAEARVSHSRILAKYAIRAQHFDELDALYASFRAELEASSEYTRGRLDATLKK